MKDENIGKQVLVVEDDMIVFKIISSVLNKYRFNAVSVSNGRETIERFDVEEIKRQCQRGDLHRIEDLFTNLKEEFIELKGNLKNYQKMICENK